MSYILKESNGVPYHIQEDGIDLRFTANGLLKVDDEVYNAAPVQNAIDDGAIQVVAAPASPNPAENIPAQMSNAYDYTVRDGATATQAQLQFRDELGGFIDADGKIYNAGETIRTYTVELVDNVTFQYLVWTGVRGGDPGDGTTVLTLTDDIHFNSSRSHPTTLGDGVGEFDMRDASLFDYIITPEDVRGGGDVLDVTTGLEAENLHMLIQDPVAPDNATVVDDNSLLGQLMAKADVANYNRLTDSLEALSDAIGTGLGIGGGGFGDASLENQEKIKDGSNGTFVDATDNLRAVRVLIDTILADTGELQTDLTNGGRLDLLIDGIKAATDNLPVDPADESLLEALFTALKGAGWTDENLTTIDANIDTLLTQASEARQAELDATNIPADLDAVLADTNELQTDLTNGGRLDLLIDGIKAATDNLPVDPADESLLEAAISTTESNIRGVDSDTLKSISDQIDTLGGGIGDATLANQNAMKDGGDGTSFAGSYDSLHALRSLLNSHTTSKIGSIDYWSGYQSSVLISTVSGVKSLPNFSVPAMPTGAQIARAVVLFKFRKVKNSSAAENAVNSTTMKIQVRKVGGIWVEAFSIADNSWNCGANTTEGGDMIQGTVSLTGQFDGAGTYEAQIVNAAADGNNLTLYDVQWGVRATIY